MKDITTIEELIEFINEHDLTSEQIGKLCSYTLGKIFVVFTRDNKEPNKDWFLMWLQNYKDKYHYLQEHEKPFIINSNMPFDIKEIYKPNDV